MEKREGGIEKGEEGMDIRDDRMEKVINGGETRRMRWIDGNFYLKGEVTDRKHKGEASKRRKMMEQKEKII